MNWKETILTPVKFIANRPDMEIHQDQTIKSAIFQSCSIINSETNGLVQRVWEYNTNYHNDDIDNFDIEFSQRDPSNELYREPYQLEQLVEAMIVQTQYMINNGNDISGGSSSFSMGGISSSWNKPTNRDILAPSVIKLLSNAGVYVMQQFTKDDKLNCDCDDKDKYETESISRSIADKRYIKKHQELAKEGDIAVIDNSKNVVFRQPTNINFNSFNTDKIKDWAQNDYKPIDKITDIIFRGQDLYGPHSAVERGEIYNLIAASLLIWQYDFSYKKDQVISALYKQGNNWTLTKFVALRDNVGKPPFENPEDWKQVGEMNADINTIVDMTYDRVVEKFNIDFGELSQELREVIAEHIAECEATHQQLRQELTQEISNKVNEVVETIRQENNTIIGEELNKLPTVEYISEANGEVLEFENQQDYEAFKTTMGVDDSYFQEVQDNRDEPTSKTTIEMVDDFITFFPQIEQHRQEYAPRFLYSFYSNNGEIWNYGMFFSRETIGNGTNYAKPYIDIYLNNNSTNGNNARGLTARIIPLQNEGNNGVVLTNYKYHGKQVYRKFFNMKVPTSTQVTLMEGIDCLLGTQMVYSEPTTSNYEDYSGPFRKDRDTFYFEIRNNILTLQDSSSVQGLSILVYGWFEYTLK